MAKSIISALRQHAELRGSLFLTAVELAHRASGSNGIVRISYGYLANKAHISKRTAMRHVAKLIDMGIISRQRFWQKNNKWLPNMYRFLIRWERPNPAQKGNGDNLAFSFPSSIEEKEKYGTIEGWKKGKQRVLGWLTPGSAVWQAVMETRNGD